MGIWEVLASKPKAVKRNEPNEMPVKDACRRSAAFAKIDHTVRTIALRYRRTADQIPAKDVGKDRGVVDGDSMKNCSSSSLTHGNGFTIFSKIGYTVRVKGVYRVIRWMKNDGTKSATRIYPANFAQNSELHESKDADEFIPGQAFAMPSINECMNYYTFGFITFSVIGYVARVNVYRFGQWMAGDDTKSTLTMYSTILSKNAHRYCIKDRDKLMIHGGLEAALFMILSNTIIDIIREHQKLFKEKVGSPQDSGDLKDKVGFNRIKGFFIFVVNKIIALMREEPFRSQIFRNGFYNMESLVLIVRELLVFTVKRYFSPEFLSQSHEIVMAISREVSSNYYAYDLKSHETKHKWGTGTW